MRVFHSPTNPALSIGLVIPHHRDHLRLEGALSTPLVGAQGTLACSTGGAREPPTKMTWHVVWIFGVPDLVGLLIPLLMEIFDVEHPGT